MRLCFNFIRVCGSSLLIVWLVSVAPLWAAALGALVILRVNWSIDDLVD